MLKKTSNLFQAELPVPTNHNSCSAKAPASAAIPCSPQIAKDCFNRSTCTHQHNSTMKILFLALTIIITLGTATAFAPSSHCNIHSHSSHGHSYSSSSSSSSIHRSRNLIITSAATIDNSPSSYEMSDFARRMKNIIRKDTRQQQQQRQRRDNNANSSQKTPRNLMRIKTLSEFKQVVGDEKEKLVVVRWYAPWCKACKAIAPSFYRLANQYPNVIFVDVPVSPENANLHQGLAVPSLPYGHIYHPAGKLVEELKISKKHFGNFASILKSYIDEECGVEFDEESGLLMEPKYGLPYEGDSNRRRMQGRSSDSM